MKTAVIYARYSSDSQTEQSIEGQIRVCNQYAKANEIVVVDTYIDRAMTGTNDNRASFQKMLKDSTKKQWNYVIVYKLDRFSRNKYESVVHKKTLKDNGVKVLSAMENIPDTPEGSLMEALLEGFNQYYSEELAQKVNRGIRESWLKGNATGGNHIFGYDIINKKYVINEYEKNIVLEIFTKYSQGFRARAIAEDLNKKGYHRLDSKPFTEKYVLFILHNSRYIGVVEHHGVIYDNIFPRIISDELWNQVDQINQENKLAPSRKKEIYDYILSGKLYCGNCKCRMSGESGTSHTKNIHYYYICSSKKKKNITCNKKAVRKQDIEDLVISTTTKLLYSEDIIKMLSERIYKVHPNRAVDNTNLQVLEQHQNEVKKGIKNIVNAIEQGIITDSTKSRLVELESELTRIEVEINKEKQRNYAFLTIEDIQKYLKSKVFKNCEDIKIRKLLVNTFIRDILLYEDKVIITYNFTEPTETYKTTTEHLENIEKQTSSALPLTQGSYKQLSSPPLAF